MRIVVGVDGSEGSATALRWALSEADARGCAVVALLAYGFYGRPRQVQDRVDGWDEEELGRAASDVLHEVVARVTNDPGGRTGPALITMVAGMEPVDALLDVATDDDVLVLGSRGLGPVRRLLLGSVSAACTRYAAGVVVVVRAPVPDAETRPVVVGVDGSAGSVAALQWAIGHACARHLPLHVVGAWSLPPNTSVRMPEILTMTEHRMQAEKQLHELVRELVGDADLRVSTEFIDGYPAAMLLEAASDAELLVVGSRGVGGFARLLLGSTGATCLVHASTSVAIIHRPEGNPEGTSDEPKE